MEFDDDIADLFEPEILADQVKEMMKLDDLKHQFKEALKPYVINTKANMNRLKDIITKCQLSHKKLTKTLKEAMENNATLKSQNKTLITELEELKSIMEECDSCQWNIPDRTKLKM